MTGDAPENLIGRQLGNYRIDGVLGKGGMSVLYRATDLRLGRKVALKIIGAHWGADPEFRERFVDEARNTSAIDHANVVPLYDFGEIDGRLYLAMRLVDGADLASLLRLGPLSPERTLRLLDQVADALDSLHQRGLVHLDVKPANVLVTTKEVAGEHVYLADFGLTRHGATGHRTRGGDFLGSPTFAAPEHLRGEPVDGRADQYALTCVLCACLTGTPPFWGDVSMVIRGHLGGEPPPISRLTGLPASIDDVIRTGLAKAPGARFGSCRELLYRARQAVGLFPGGPVMAAGDTTIPSFLSTPYSPQLSPAIPAGNPGSSVPPYGGPPSPPPTPAAGLPYLTQPRLGEPTQSAGYASAFGSPQPGTPAGSRPNPGQSPWLAPRPIGGGPGSPPSAPRKSWVWLWLGFIAVAIGGGVTALVVMLGTDSPGPTPDIPVGPPSGESTFPTSTKSSNPPPSSIPIQPSSVGFSP